MKKKKNKEKVRYDEENLIRCSCRYHRVLAVRKDGKIYIKCKGCGDLIAVIDEKDAIYCGEPSTNN